MGSATKARRKTPVKGNRQEESNRKLWAPIMAVALAGCLWGLSAPGLDQWYLSWFGLIPLFLAVSSAADVKQACLRGFTFAFGYNLVYLHWYLGLYPLNWLGFSPLPGALLAIVSWLAVAVHQSVITAVFAMLMRLIPMTGGFLPGRVEGQVRWPALVSIPLLWILVHNKLGNAHNLLGVPWPMIEYSQYRQLPLIQSASWIGGIGVGFILVLCNAALSGLAATLTGKLSLKPLASPTLGQSVRHCLLVGLALSVLISCGWCAMCQPEPPAKVNLAVLQGNVNIDMQRSQHRFTLEQILHQFQRLARQAPPGILVSGESAIPAFFRREPQAMAALRRESRLCHLNMVIGAVDTDRGGRLYNAAFGITDSGVLLPSVYHKRYLVPFGEYMPAFVAYLPEWIRRLTSTPKGHGFTAGDRPAVLDMPVGTIAPTICFEALSPELVSASVRNGGELLVNLSDLSWFHNSIVGDQMLAFSVFRAVENGRYFVFAANTGPSAIIDPQGRIVERSPGCRPTVMKGKVSWCSQRTVFTGWFR